MATLTNNDLVALDAKMFSKHRYKKVLVLCEDCFGPEQTHGVGIHEPTPCDNCGKIIDPVIDNYNLVNVVFTGRTAITLPVEEEKTDG